MGLKKYFLKEHGILPLIPFKLKLRNFLKEGLYLFGSLDSLHNLAPLFFL
jgi:hypothetical protein